MNVESIMKKYKLKEGQLVKVINEEKTFEGNILPQDKKRQVLKLKLKSGYNVGVKLTAKTKIEKMQGIAKVKKEKKTAHAKNSGLPVIGLIHTGGTIASRVDYETGGVVSGFDEEDILTMYPEISEKARFETAHIGNMWSHDIRFGHYKVMARAIEKMAKKGVEGVIMGQGTDTIGYTLTALAFMLENINIPVLIVGSQRSSDRGSTDARMNLDCAVEFILNTDFAGVGLCMHNSSSDDKCAILPAGKTRKMHSSRRDAFKAINDTPIALVDYKTKKIEYLKKDYPKKDSSKKLIVKDKFEEKVAILKIHTNMHPEQFSLYAKNGFKGVIIEGTGLGHCPGFATDEYNKIHSKIWKALEEMTKKCVVVMTTQTINGRIQMHVYSKGVKLTEIGVIPGEDMLTETAFIKLAWLLGNYPKEKVRELIGKNLRGEISEATKYEEEFVE